MSEVKPIKGYEEVYSVSSDGAVYSHRYLKTKRLKLMSQGTGYHVVYLYSEEGRKTHLVHRLVADAFILNPEEKPMVNHKDSNRKNNRVENLEWCTAQENSDHGKSCGFISQNGSKSHRAKLSEEKVLEVRDKHIRGRSMYSLAKEYGVTQGTIRFVVNRVTWKHI